MHEFDSVVFFHKANRDMARLAVFPDIAQCFLQDSIDYDLCRRGDFIFAKAIVSLDGQARMVLFKLPAIPVEGGQDTDVIEEIRP